MEQSELQLLLAHIENEKEKFNESMVELKRMVNRLNEENNRLRIQNDNLLALVTNPSEQSEDDNGETVKDSSKLKNGKDRLHSFYQEGIHVCHPFFGSKREISEECMFCQSVLDSLDA